LSAQRGVLYIPQSKEDNTSHILSVSHLNIGSA